MPTGVAEVAIRERIAAAIAEGDFPPGTQLVESMLAERFGVSRSPVRGALRALEGDGLVVHHPHRGDFVAALSPSDIEEIFYLREVLEIAAVRLAYRRIPADELRRVEQLLGSLSTERSPREDFLASDDILHDLIARNSDNGRLRYALKQLSAQIQFTRRTSMSRKERLAANLAEHKEIVAALRLGDLPLIEARLRVHLRAGKESTLEACRAMPSSPDGGGAGAKAARGRSRRARGASAAASQPAGLGGVGFVSVTRVLSPTAILGYGFPLDSFRNGVRRRPHVIAVDAGSTDPGPYYLGAGKPFTDRGAVLRDLRLLVEAARSEGIPLLIGTAGGSGGEPHLERDLELLLAAARELDVHFTLAVIHAEVDKDRVKRALRSGQMSEIGPVPKLTEAAVEAAARIVGQMGSEPLTKALESGAQVVLAGRAYDPAVFAAVPLRRGCGRGPAIHLGKILECGAIAATPGSGSDCLFGYLDGDSFEVEPLNPERRCTVTSVAAHTLYEKSDPLTLPGPGGRLDLRQTGFEQVERGRVRVSGSRFVPSDDYQVKLEGAEKVGYRTLSLAGCRDPFMIAAIDDVVESVTQRALDNFEMDRDDCTLSFKLYGKDGVMGALEPCREHTPLELGIVIEAVAPTQQMADTLCSFARSTMLHCSYPGRIATGGNLAFPYSPSDLPAGEVYRFSVYHLMSVDDPCELFPIELVAV